MMGTEVLIQLKAVYIILGQTSKVELSACTWRRLRTSDYYYNDQRADERQAHSVELVLSSSSQLCEVVAMWPHQNRGLPPNRVLKPSDRSVPCLASKLVINSTLLMAGEAMSVPADRTPLGHRQSFHLLIGAQRTLWQTL